MPSRTPGRIPDPMAFSEARMGARGRPDRGKLPRPVTPSASGTPLASQLPKRRLSPFPNPGTTPAGRASTAHPFRAIDGGRRRTTHAPANLISTPPGDSSERRREKGRRGRTQQAGTSTVDSRLGHALLLPGPETCVCVELLVKRIAGSSYPSPAESARSERAPLAGRSTRCYLVDPASSHMLVSKIKPCMSKYKPLQGETANGSLDQLWFLRSYNPTWITVAILELIHATKLRPLRGRALLLVQNQCRLSGAG